MSWLVESGSGAFDNTTGFELEDNVTLSCAARSIQGPVQQPYPDTIVTTLRVYQSIFLFLVSFSGMFLNVLLVVLVAKYKALQTLDFGLAAQVIASGIIASFIFLFGMLNSIANRWLFGVHMCRITGLIFFASFLVRTQSLFTFVINRFTSVFLPYDYPKRQRAVVITLSLVSWVIAFTFAISLYIFDCYDFQPDTWVCYIASACSSTCGLITTTSTAIVVTPSAIIPVFLYTMLFIKAKKAKNAINPAGVERKAYDWKATITFFVMFLSTFALTLPNLITALSIAIIYENEPPLGLHLLYVLATSMLSSLPVVDAIVILRNRDVKEIVVQLKEKITRKLWKR